MDIVDLINKFSNDKLMYQSSRYNETQLRIDFLDPFLSLLGWDITNANGKPTNEREVLVEEGLKEKKGATTKKPDYTFRLYSERKFFVEAKKPCVDICNDPMPAKQIRRYGFTAKLKISVLSNFEYLAIYDCSSQVQEQDAAHHSRVKLYHYTEYANNFNEILSLMGRESVYAGQFDNEWIAIEDKINKFSANTLFLSQINEWRLQLAKNFISIKPDIAITELNDLTQLYINSIVFLRVCEDRNLEVYETLLSFSQSESYSSLIKNLSKSDRKYNSGLFTLKYIDDFISDKNSYIWVIIKQLYYPESTYSFAVFSSDILGNIYEIFLGDRISCENDEIRLVPKEENINRDVVTTPTYIIRDILRKTVVEYCKNKSDIEILSSKFADIACGSGAFLLELFQMIQDILIDYYLLNDKTKLQPVGYSAYKLKYETKHNILVSCIYGIDKDYNAVKAAEFGLLLKLLEDEDSTTVSIPVLPKLNKNIYFGNSLIESGYISSEKDSEIINPFDFGQLKFDVIVGNPPYLSTENIKKITPLELPIYEKRYFSAYKQFDKYFLFVERAIGLLNEGGYFGYILPSKFMKVGAGRKLREFLTKKRLITEIVTFGANQVFENRTTYTCLLFARKNKIDNFTFIEVGNLDDWKIRSDEYVNVESVSLKSLSADTWILEKDTQSILDMLARKTKPLGTILGKKAIENGIQTSANKEYIHQIIKEDSSYIYFQYNKNEYQIEKSLTRPYYKTIKKGIDNLYTYRDLQPNSFVVYPYQKIDGCITLIGYEELEKKYPCAFRFINVIRDKLDNKNRDIKPTPKTQNEWYRYGRSQSLENCDVPEKIVVGVLSNGYKYSIDRKRTFISSGGTAGYCPINVPHDCRYSIFYIQALLSSKYLEWFASIYGEIFRGGFVARGTKVLSRMPIVEIDFENHASKALHDDISNLQKSLNETFAKIELADERKAIPLRRTFKRLKEEMDSKLKELFDLGVWDSKIPAINEIYNKNIDD